MSKRFFLIGFIILFLDQFTKIVVMRTMELGKSIPILGNFFQITYATNTGSAFSLFLNQTTLLMWLSVVVIGFVLYNYERMDKKNYVPWALVFGGALGNFIDRLSYGYVVDFLNFSFWPNFNVADSALTIGVVWLIVLLMKE